MLNINGLKPSKTNDFKPLSIYIALGDFSRLGRDYITAGQYTEMLFPQWGVRYISISDGYDSANSYDDLTPFKHVIKESNA